MKRILILSVALVAISVGSPANAKMENSKTNHPSYWGASCTKTEMSGSVRTFNAPRGASKVIVKGGPTYVVYDKAPLVNLTAPVNPNNKHNTTYDISHVIVCIGAKVMPVTGVKTPGKEAKSPIVKKPVLPVGVNGDKIKKEAPVQKLEAILPAELPKTGASQANVGLYALIIGLATYVGTLVLRTKQDL